MSGPIAVGGAVITAVLVGGTGFARWWVRPVREVEEPRPRPRGRHRAPAALAPAPLPDLEPVPGPGAVQALVIREQRCPTCRADTDHIRFALGGLMCPSCPPWGL